MSTPPVADATPDEARAAAATIRRTATRLGASDADLDHALAALFAPTVSVIHHAGIGLSRIKDGTPLSDEDKRQIVALLADGVDTAAIIDRGGCSRQAVSGVRVAWKAGLL